MEKEMADELSPPGDTDPTKRGDDSSHGQGCASVAVVKGRSFSTIKSRRLAINNRHNATSMQGDGKDEGRRPGASFRRGGKENECDSMKPILGDRRGTSPEERSNNRRLMIRGKPMRTPRKADPTCPKLDPTCHNGRGKPSNAPFRSHSSRLEMGKHPTSSQSPRSRRVAVPPPSLKMIHTTTPSSHHKAVAAARMMSQQRHGNHRELLIKSGPLRIKTPAKKSTGSFLKKSPPRIGIDGTEKTPSKELLRSTACSRAQQVQSKDHKRHRSPTAISPNDRPSKSSLGHSRKASVDAMLKAVDMNVITNEMMALSLNDAEKTKLDESVSDEIISVSAYRSVDSPIERQSCLNPVAITLLNDGKEDLDHLLERDVFSTTDEKDVLRRTNSQKILHDNNQSSPVVDIDRTPAPQAYTLCKVSGSLTDVMSQEEVVCLARPVAIHPPNEKLEPHSLDQRCRAAR